MIACIAVAALALPVPQQSIQGHQQVPYLPGAPGGAGNGGTGGTGGDGGLEGDPVEGTRVFFRLREELDPAGSPERVVVGDLNQDGIPDAAVVSDGRVFVIAGPDVMRGGLVLDGLGSVSDLEVLPDAGPDGQDLLVTVGSAGLLASHFVQGTASFTTVTLDAGLWLGATSVRRADLDGSSPTELVGSAAGRRDVLAWWTESATATVLATTTETLLGVEVLDWTGDGAQEVAARTDAGLRVYDGAGAPLAQLGSATVPRAAKGVRRPGESAERLAWIAPSERGNDVLHVAGAGLPTETSVLPALDVRALASGDLNGDGGDELFLSHRVSSQQIVLVNSAVPGDPLSRTFDAARFTLVDALPPQGAVIEDAGLIGGPRVAPGPVQGFQGGGTGGGSANGNGQPSHVVFGGGGGGGAGGGLPAGGTSSLDPLLLGAELDEPDASGWNPFARNEAEPALSDLDGDGDLDLLFPASTDGLFLLMRGVEVDERALKLYPGASSVQPFGADQLRLLFEIVPPGEIPEEATHVELVVRTSTVQTELGIDVEIHEELDMGEGFPGTLDIVLAESELPSGRLYHIALRFTRMNAEETVVERTWPTAVAVYTSINPLFESLFAGAGIRGGGKTSPKTGPVFVGGIAPRPHLDAFMPGIMPRAPGGGQVL